MILFYPQRQRDAVVYMLMLDVYTGDSVNNVYAVAAGECHSYGDVIEECQR